MYTTHFALTRSLFHTGIAQDDGLLIPDAHRQSALELQAKIALSTPDAAIVLLGPPGIGKTTQAAALQRSSLPGTAQASRDKEQGAAEAAEVRTASAWLTTPPATGHELLESLLVEFGFEPYKQSRAERLQTWRQLLVELDATQTRIFIAVERADEADPAMLRTLDTLTAPDPTGCAGANLILMGEDRLRELLDHPALAGLRQRVRLVHRLAPLDERGLIEYLRQAVEAAGGRFDRLFAADAIEPLAMYSRGIPRMLNNLVDSALALCAARGETTVTAALIDEVANDFYGLSSVVAESEHSAVAIVSAGENPAVSTTATSPDVPSAPVSAEATTQDLSSAAVGTMATSQDLSSATVGTAAASQDLSSAAESTAAAHLDAGSATDIPILTDWIDDDAILTNDDDALTNDNQNPFGNEGALPLDSTATPAPDTYEGAVPVNESETVDETARARDSKDDHPPALTSGLEAAGQAALVSDSEPPDDATLAFDDVLDTLDPIVTLALLGDELDEPTPPPLEERQDPDGRSDSRADARTSAETSEAQGNSPILPRGRRRAAR